MTTPEQADDEFFAALVAGDADAVDALLARGFLIVSVVDGSVVQREQFVAVIRDRRARFDAIDVLDRTTRLYGGVALLVGRTAVHGTIGGEPFEAESRYTHVLVTDEDRWRLASAQDTPIWWAYCQASEAAPYGAGGRGSPTSGRTWRSLPYELSISTSGTSRPTAGPVGGGRENNRSAVRASDRWATPPRPRSASAAAAAPKPVA